MENQFIPYNLALKLKELGFDNKSLGFSYMRFNCEGISNGTFEKVVPNYLYNSYDLICTAPLWQQSFDWFREEKGLLNHLTTHLNTWGEDSSLETSFGYRIMIDKDGWKCDVWEQLSRYETYEEARQACLEKLIELCEKN